MQIQVFNYALNYTNTGSKKAVLHVDGDIVDASTQEMLQKWWGDETSVSYRSMRDQMEQCMADGCTEFEINVNSPGGHIGDAMAFYDYAQELQRKGIVINTVARGIVASAATLFVNCTTNSTISANTMYMIHEVQGAISGGLKEIKNYLNVMEKYQNMIRDNYVTTTTANGIAQTPENVSRWMNAETWFSGKEAVEKGFVKNLTGNVAFDKPMPTNKWTNINGAFLNKYNSFVINKTEQMEQFDHKIWGETLMAKIESWIGNKTSKETITDELGKLFAPLNTHMSALETGIDEKITNAVKTTMEAMTAKLPTAESIVASIDKALTDKGVVTKEQLSNLEADIAKKLGNSAHNSSANIDNDEELSEAEKKAKKAELKAKRTTEALMNSGDISFGG